MVSDQNPIKKYYTGNYQRNGGPWVTILEFFLWVRSSHGFCAQQMLDTPPQAIRYASGMKTDDRLQW